MSVQEGFLLIDFIWQNEGISEDDDRFFSVAMQVAAHAARRGHGRLAEELRTLIDRAKSKPGAGAPIPIGRPRGELANLLEASHPSARLGQMVLGEELGDQIPVLAGELGLPLLQVRLDGLITKYMGETAAKLRQIFEATGRTRGVYFFDEFDAIGSQRGLANDVGEIRRVLNSFLQMIEQDRSHSLVIAATNHPRILDPALFRRFDDILHYELPDGAQIAQVLRTRLASDAVKRIRWRSLADLAAGLSYAEVVRAADEVLKDALIHERPLVREADVRVMLKERRTIADKLATRQT